MINVLGFYIAISRNMCSVPIVVVFYGTMLLYLPGMLLTYIMTDFGRFPVAPIVSVFFCTYHLHCISVVKASLHFKIFSTFFFITFLSPDVAVIINSYAYFSLSDIMFLLRFTFSFQGLITLRPRIFLHYFGTCS